MNNPNSPFAPFQTIYSRGMSMRRAGWIVLILILLPVVFLPGVGPVTADSGCAVAQPVQVASEAQLNEAITAFNGETTGPCAFTIELTADIAISSSTAYINNAASDVELILDGAGFKIDGQDNPVRLVDIGSNTDVSIQDITLTRANFNSDGGAILNVGNLTLSGSTVSDSYGADGGGLFNSGVAVILNSTFSANEATNDGAIFNEGTLTLANSTLSANKSNYGAAAIRTSGDLTLTNSTIFDNEADDGFLYGRAVVASDGNTTISNSIIANGRTHDCHWSGEGSFNSFSTLFEDSDIDACGLAASATPDADGNLTGVEPKLGPLQDNGGPTHTHALLPDSPARDMGDNGRAKYPDGTDLTTDQRGAGFPRLSMDGVDMGAYEYQCAPFPREVGDEDELNDAILCYNGITGDGTYTIILLNDILLSKSTLAIDNATVDVELLIDGAGFTVDGQNILYVLPFEVAVSTVVSMQNITVTGGKEGDDRLGGGITNNGELTVTSSTISGNNAKFDGGGIKNYGNLTINDSTISGNEVPEDGGGIYNIGTLTITNSTLSGNEAGYLGGGIRNYSGTTTISNSIIANSIGKDCVLEGGTFESFNSLFKDTVQAACGLAESLTPDANGNLVGVDPTLGPLQDNGGPTQTHALLPHSPSRDMGDNGRAKYPDGGDLTTDQRGSGYARISINTVDMGAYESQCATFPSEVSNEDELNDAILCYNDITSDGTYTITLLNDILLGKSTVKIDNDTADVELILEGADFAVDGQDTDGVRPFEIAANTVVSMTQITVTGGKQSDAHGGGILNRGELTISDSSISENDIDKGSLKTEGGGIYNDGQLTIVNSAISNNEAFRGGGIYSENGKVTLTNSVVSSNEIHVGVGYGGGIFSSGELIISESTISMNRAAKGGGIFGNNKITISDSTIIENDGMSDGGGIKIVSGTASIRSSTITGNWSETSGGGLRNSGTTWLINSTVSGNTAKNRGGGIWNEGNLSITNSTVADNEVYADEGGGIYNREGTMTISNSIVANSIKKDCVLEAGTFASFNSLFGNTIQAACGLAESLTPDANGNLVGVDPKLGPLQDNGGPTETHALLQGSPVLDRGDDDLAKHPDGSDIDYDQRGPGFPRIFATAVDMGAYENSCEYPGFAADEAQLNDAIRCFNQATESGHYSITLLNNIPLSKSTVAIDNPSAGVELLIEGAGFAVDGQQRSKVRPFEINPDTVVSMNQITITGGHNTTAGGGILNKGDLTLTGSTITANRLSSNASEGGGIRNMGRLSVINSTISDNYSPGSGGISNRGEVVTIVDSKIIGNGAHGFFGTGGGISHNAGEMRIVNSTISGNDSGYGGGIGCSGEKMTISNSTISGNTADKLGGGIRNSCSALITNTTVSDNIAGEGGGIHNNSDVALVLNNSIVANSLGVPDCYVTSGSVTGSHSLIESNNNCGLSDGVDGNIIGLDPDLGPLQNNGGPTETHALDKNSPAIDAGLNGLAVDPNGVRLEYDQRGPGYPRLNGGTVDMGAFETLGGVDLALSKHTKPDGETKAGLPFDFIIFVDNLGDDSAMDVTVDDTLFSSIPYSLRRVWDDRAACEVDTPQIGVLGSTLPFSCTLDELEVDGRWIIYARVVAGRPGDVNNEARVSSAFQEDSKPDNNTDTAEMHVIASADIGVVKTAETTAVNAGDVATWTVTVTNAGPSPAEQVLVSDTLPAAILPGSVKVLPAVLGCTIGATTTCNLGTMPKDGEVVLTISGRVNPNVAAPGITNNVAIRSDTHDPDGGNNRTSAAVAVKQTGDLTIFKQSLPAAVDAGEPLTYAIHISSGPPSTAAAVIVKDALPPEFEFDTVTLLGGNGNECAYATGAHEITCALGDLPPGTDREIQINGSIKPETQLPQVSNTAIVRSTSATHASSTATTDVGASARLSATKRSLTSSPQSGEVFSYEVEVTNHGPSLARNVQVFDELTGSVKYLYSKDVLCSSDDEKVTCTLGDLAVGQTATFELVVQVKKFVKDGHHSDSMLGVTSATPPTYERPLFVYSEEIVFRNVNDLQIRKFGKPDDSVAEGQKLTYTIVVDNFGPGVAYNTEVIDLIASDGAYSFKAPNFCTPKSGSANGNKQITCSLGHIWPGKQEVFTIEVTANEAQSLNNQADVKSDGKDLDNSNNHAIVEHQIEDVADVGLTITADKMSVLSGGALRYTLQITNHGPSQARNVLLLNNLSANAVATDITIGQGSCTLDPLVCGLGHLANGQTVGVTIKAVTHNALASGLAIVNNVQVSTETFDDNNSNDQGYASTAVTAVRRLRLTMSSSEPHVKAGQLLTLHVNAANKGQGEIEDVRVNVALSPLLIYIADTAGCGAGLSACPMGDIAAGQEIGFDITVRLNETHEGDATARSHASINAMPGIEVDTAGATVTIPAGANAPTLLLPLIRSN